MASIVFNVFSSRTGCFSCSGITMHATISSYEICFVRGLFDYRNSFCIYCLHLVNFVLIGIRPTTFINTPFPGRIPIFPPRSCKFKKKDNERYKNEMNWDYKRLTYCPLGLFCFLNLLSEGVSGLKELTLSRKNWTFLIISHKTSRRVVVLNRISRACKPPFFIF